MKTIQMKGKGQVMMRREQKVKVKVSILEWNSSSTDCTFLKLYYCYYYFICITMYNKQMTEQYTINVYAEVTMHKIFKYTRFQGTESKGRVHFLRNFSILLVSTHIYFSVSYLILTLDEKAVMIGRV